MSSSANTFEHLAHHIGIAVGDHLAQPRQTIHVVLGHCRLLVFGLHHPREWSSGRLFVRRPSELRTPLPGTLTLLSLADSNRVGSGRDDITHSMSPGRFAKHSEGRRGTL